MLGQVMVAAGASCYMAMNLVEKDKQGNNVMTDSNILADFDISNEASIYKFIPLALVFLLSFFIASSFFNLYDMCLRTILIMYCRAKHHNADRDDVPTALQDFMHDINTTVKAA